MNKVFPKKSVRWWCCSGPAKDMDSTGVTGIEAHSLCSNSEGRTELTSLTGRNIETPTEVPDSCTKINFLSGVLQFLDFLLNFIFNCCAENCSYKQTSQETVCKTKKQQINCYIVHKFSF